MDLKQLQQAAMDKPREVLPLEYSATRRELAPFDVGGAVRQIVFAAGVGFIAGGLVDWLGTSAWKDNEVLWIGFGAALVALTLPWPGRIGRVRPLKGE
jgi:hypothetical protein